ncbi:hypothetical protein LTR56_026547 [Elasticomyces elasticus]|nr:hypothetical protein LTR56_026547 [Elasticomyces elasticus]
MAPGNLVKWDDPRSSLTLTENPSSYSKYATLSTRFKHMLVVSSNTMDSIVAHERAELLGTSPWLSRNARQDAGHPQGLFSNAGKTYPLAIRYANEPSFLQDDRAPGPRGCGMKVFGVEGAFMDEAGNKTKTQDFTFNNAPLLELTDLPKTVEIFKIRERNFSDPYSLKAEINKREDKDLQFAPAGLPNHHFMAYTMYSQSAYRYGDYVAKYAMFPREKLQQELAEKAKVNEESDPEQHSLWLREYFNEHDAEFDFRIQLCQDINEQSVEDCSKPWDEEKYPFETVAKITLSKGQDVFEAKRRAFWDDHMKLNVWYGLEAHRPLGSVNRLRKQVNQASVAKRAAINAVEVRLISSIDDIP